MVKVWKVGNPNQGAVTLSKLLIYPDFGASICKAAVQVFATSQEQWVLEQVTSLNWSDCGAVFPSPPQSSTPLLCCQREFPSGLMILIPCEFSVHVPLVSHVPPSFCPVLCEFWIVFDLVLPRVLFLCAACGFVPCVDIWRSQSKCQCTYLRYSNPACLPVPALCPDCC